MTDSSDPLVVVDIGCRWGFAERFLKADGRVRVYGFDPDRAECARLEAIYAERSPGSVTLVPLALAGQPGRRRLHLTREPACSSLFEPDPALTSTHPSLDCARLVGTEEIEVVRLDDWAQDAGIGRIDYLKLDTQGSELEILQGAERVLAGVRCLQVEVEFNPIYRGQPIFSDVDGYLRARGFVLWRLTNLVHYSHGATAIGPVAETAVHYDDAHRYTYPVHGGQLYWADAYYVRADALLPREAGDALRRRDAELFGLVDLSDVALHVSRVVDARVVGG
jgi:FkbM family methyltransferase